MNRTTDSDGIYELLWYCRAVVLVIGVLDGQGTLERIQHDYNAFGGNI